MRLHDNYPGPRPVSSSGNEARHEGSIFQEVQFLVSVGLFVRVCLRVSVYGGRGEGEQKNPEKD